MDRLNWAHSNSHRTDIVMLPRQQTVDLDDTTDQRQRPRGYRVDGKVLPVEERFFSHWNTDPWQLDYPGNGQTFPVEPSFFFLTSWEDTTGSSRNKNLAGPDSSHTRWVAWRRMIMYTAAPIANVSAVPTTFVGLILAATTPMTIVDTT